MLVIAAHRARTTVKGDSGRNRDIETAIRSAVFPQTEPSPPWPNAATRDKALEQFAAPTCPQDLLTGLTAHDVITLHERLIARMDQDQTGTGKRRQNGMYYTPKVLTQYLVEQALGPIVAGTTSGSTPLTVDQILNLTILDPAMGAGRFLIEVVAFLAGACLAVSTKKNQQDCVDETTRRAMYARLVATRCIYGVDRDRGAVAVARLAVLLATAEHGKPLAGAPEHFLCGDALVGMAPADLDTINPGQPVTDEEADRWLEAQLGTRVACDNGPPPLHWPVAFPDVFARGGFTCVLGNPPYLSQYSRQSVRRWSPDPALDRLAHDRLSKIDGRTAVSGRINHFLLFVVRAAQLAKPRGGRCALVLPDTLLTNASYQDCRKALTATGRLESVVRFRDGVFPGATVGTAVVLWGSRRTIDAPVTLIDAKNLASLRDGTMRHTSVRVASLLDRPGCRWQVPDLSWAPAAPPPASRHRMCRLEDIASVRDGINPGSKATRRKLLSTDGDKGPSWRLCLEGKCILPFHICKPQLWVRYDPSMITPDQRRGGTSLRAPWVFDQPKIVYRQTAPCVIPAVDRAGLCSLNSVHQIILHDANETVLHALCGYLGSPWFNATYARITGETRRTFPQVHITSMKSMPVPRVLADAHASITQEMCRLAKRLATRPEDQARTMLKNASDDPRF